MPHARAEHMSALEALTTHASPKLADSVPGAQEAVRLAGTDADQLVDRHIAKVRTTRTFDASTACRKAQISTEGAVIVFRDAANE